MRLKSYTRLKKYLFLAVLFQCLSCAKDINSEVEVYQNDFETSNLEDISNGRLEQYNGSMVLGRYNNDSFTLTLNDLPRHDLLEVSFDLYIHDSWDGNKAGDSGHNGPDIWKMLVDGNTYINTTFSNADCGSVVFCDPQSYPADYLNSNNNPRTGAFRQDLPGVCHNAGIIGGTIQYKISKRIRHNKKTFNLQCLDLLIQTNTNDPLCDESWSVDNISIKAVRL